MAQLSKQPAQTIQARSRSATRTSAVKHDKPPPRRIGQPVDRDSLQGGDGRGAPISGTSCLDEESPPNDQSNPDEPATITSATRPSAQSEPTSDPDAAHSERDRHLPSASQPNNISNPSNTTPGVEPVDKLPPTTTVSSRKRRRSHISDDEKELQHLRHQRRLLTYSLTDSTALITRLHAERNIARAERDRARSVIEQVQRQRDVARTQLVARRSLRAACDVMLTVSGALGAAGAYVAWCWVNAPELAYIRGRMEEVYGR